MTIIRILGYNETRYFDYKFHVEKGNATLKSIHGVLYSKDGKILHGIPSTLKGKLVIPDSVKEIRLSFNLKLSELVLGKNVTNISYNYFREWDNLKTIRVKKGNHHFKVLDNTLYSKDMKKLLFSVSNRTGCFEMPKKVEAMDPYAFCYTKFSKIITSDKLKEIPKCAFYPNENLKELVIGSHVKKIGKLAVEYGTLNKITVKNGNEYFVEKDGHLYNKDLSRLYF